MTVRDARFLVAYERTDEVVEGVVGNELADDDETDGQQGALKNAETPLMKGEGVGGRA